MSTYKRGRTNKLEVNLTSSFIAGGTQYTHHPDSLVTSYRFEEPYVVDVDTTASLVVRDSSGFGRDALVTSCSFDPISVVPVAERCLPLRSAKSTPYLFSKNTMKSSGLTDIQRLTTPVAVSGEQIRVLHFSTGSSERVEFPLIFSSKINEVEKLDTNNVDKIFETGLTFSFWLKLDGSDTLFSSVLPGGYYAKNPYTERSIFSADRNDYFEDLGLNGDEIDFGKAFSVRVINDPSSSRHRKISVVASFVNDLGEKIQIEWLSRKALEENAWTHIGVVFPLSFSSLGNLDLKPKIFFDGEECIVDSIPVDVKNKITLQVANLDPIFNTTGDLRYINLYIETPHGDAKKTSLLRLSTADFSSAPLDIFPSATIKLSAGFDDTANHLSTFTVKDTQGKEANFLIDLFHTGTISTFLNGNTSEYSPQMVNPLSENLLSIDINYDSYLSSGDNFKNPRNNAYVRLTTPNNLTRIYQFDQEAEALDQFIIDDLYSPLVVAAVATADLNATYDNANKTLTYTSSGNFTLEGVTNFAVGDLILVQGQSEALENGIYSIDDLGSTTVPSPWILVRASGFENDTNFNSNLVRGSTVIVDNFIDQAGRLISPRTYIFNTKGPVVLGTTEIDFVEFLRGPDAYAYTTFRLASQPGTAFDANVKFKIYDSKSNHYVSFESDDTGASFTHISSTEYKFGVSGVTSPGEYVGRIFDALYAAYVVNSDLSVEIGGIKKSSFSTELKDRVRQDVVDSSVIPMTLMFEGQPYRPDSFPDSGRIVFDNGSEYFDVAFDSQFSMGDSPVISEIFFSPSGDLSHGFELGSGVFKEQIIGNHSVRNFSGFPTFNYTEGKIDYSCVDDKIIRELSVGHPIIIFGNGSSINDVNDISVNGDDEGVNFNSKRFIKFNVPINGDAVIRFDAIPASSLSNLNNTVSRKLVNPPLGADKGLHVQYSLDGENWESYDPTSTQSYVRKSKPLTNLNLESVTDEDFESVPSWRHFSFWVHAPAQSQDNVSTTYFVRLIQEGYDTSFSDNWAVTNLSIECKTHYGVKPNSFDSVNIVPLKRNPAETWDLFVESVNSSSGHNGEIIAQHLPDQKIVKLTFQSPAGIIDVNNTGTKNLLGQFANRSLSLRNNFGFAHSLRDQNKIKLNNFLNNKSLASHIRIGLKGAYSISDANSRIATVIGFSSASYSESKILDAKNLIYQVDIYSNFISEKTFQVNQVQRPSGDPATGWTIDGFTKHRFAKSFGFHGTESETNYLSIAASKIASIINEFSSSFGVRAYATSSLSDVITIEHVDNNTFGDACKVSVYSVENSSPVLEDEMIVAPPSKLFSGGLFEFRTLPAGYSIEAFGSASLGTSPRDLELFMNEGIPGFFIPYDCLPHTSSFASSLGGRSPKCMIDDFSVWSRCLLPDEIRALTFARRGSYKPTSGLSSFDPRIQLVDEDNSPGVYPTVSRITDEDFTGRTALRYVSDSEIVGTKPYSTAELIFRDLPQAKSSFTITDWKSTSKTFRFYKNEREKIPSAVNIFIQENLDQTIRSLVKNINKFSLGDGSGFGISAKMTASNKVLLTQTGIVGEHETSTGNTTITKSGRINCKIPAAFSGDSKIKNLNFALKIDENNPLIKKMTSAGHARPTLRAPSPADMSPSLVSSLVYANENITPYREIDQLGAFGSSLHQDADINFIDSNKIGPKGSFWSTGSNFLPEKTSPVWSKHKIEIDLQPLQKTKLFKHLTTGSTTAYYNFDLKTWEPIGHFATGSFRTTSRGSNSLAKSRLIINMYHSGTGDEAFTGDTLTDKLIFSLEDSYGKKVSFVGGGQERIPDYADFKRESKSLYYVRTDGKNSRGTVFTVKVATTTGLPNCTYNNGTSGFEATLTADAPGLLPDIDGISLATIRNGDFILVKDQTNPNENGVYKISDVGHTTGSWVLTRPTFLDASTDFGNNIAIDVLYGITNYQKRFFDTTEDDFVVGTSDVTYERTKPYLCFFDALNAAYHVGDINIRPTLDPEDFISNVTLRNGAIDLIQVDAGKEGNKKIIFNRYEVIATGVFLEGSMCFFEQGQTSFVINDQVDKFLGGDWEEVEASSYYGKSYLYSTQSLEDPRSQNFRRWLDTLTIGFGPSIGIKAVKSNSPAAGTQILLGSGSAENKYVFLDGGLSSPVSTFGFPYHPKFHATGSQTLDVTSLIDRPFLVEKIAYCFRANLNESGSIQTFVGGDTKTSSSYGSESDYNQPAFINLPTPTFFILNQKKCRLPHVLSNKINVLSLADESGLADESFVYTASVPSNFYLTSMSDGPGAKTNVDDIRELVTFARFTSAPSAFSQEDYESFVFDVRKNSDLVLVPSSSEESIDNEIFRQENFPNAAFTILAPCRSPGSSEKVSTFRTENDFFGSDKTTFKFSVNNSLINPDSLAFISDPLVLQDSAGVIRRFAFYRAQTAASLEFNGTMSIRSFLGINDLFFSMIDSAGKEVTFQFRTDILLNVPSRISNTLYYVGVLGVSAGSGSRYTTEVCVSLAAAVNLAYRNGDLDIFALCGNCLLSITSSPSLPSSKLVAEVEILSDEGPGRGTTINIVDTMGVSITIRFVDTLTSFVEEHDIDLSLYATRSSFAEALALKINSAGLTDVTATFENQFVTVEALTTSGLPSISLVTEPSVSTELKFYQGTGGTEGNTTVSVSPTFPPLLENSFSGGTDNSLGSEPRFIPGSSNFVLDFLKNLWLIPIFRNLLSEDADTYYASQFYKTLTMANQIGEPGSFSTRFILQQTGSVPTREFTFSQSIGGQKGIKNIGGSGDSLSFEDKFVPSDIPFSRFSSIEVIQEGQIQKDIIDLQWHGNRTGIKGVQTGRSPRGGENFALNTSYKSLDGTGHGTVHHGLFDSTDSPYLLMPGDKLVFGWQSPIGTGSHSQPGAVESEFSGSFEILPGAGKLILYGSVLQNDLEKSHVTSNQPLTSEALHEAIFSNADVCDVYDTDPYIYHFDNSLDQFVDGIVEMNASPPQFTRQVASHASEGNHSVGPRDGSYPIFSKRAGFIRGFKSIDQDEILFDSMTPAVDELMSRDNIYALDPGYNDGANNSRTGVIVLAHPSLTASNEDFDYSNSCWHKWMAAYPFEPRYAGLTRYEGFKTGITLSAASGSFVTGLRQIRHVWLANNSNVIRSYHDEDAVQADYVNMLNNIQAPRLFLDSSANEIASRQQPYNINFSIVTDESGEGPPGEAIDTLDFAGKFLGTKIGPRSKYFFSRLFFGTGDGTYRFPKLPYWKNIFADSGQGFDLNETFPVTRGVVIRGFKYGLANVVPTRTSSIFRRDHFGFFRDQLEQRPFTKTYTSSDAISDNTPVVVQFRSRANGSIVDPLETNSANVSLYCTSSVPYNDGVYLDRHNLSPDDASPLNVVYAIL